MILTIRFFRWFGLSAFGSFVLGGRFSFTSPSSRWPLSLFASLLWKDWPGEGGLERSKKVVLVNTLIKNSMGGPLQYQHPALASSALQGTELPQPLAVVERYFFVGTFEWWAKQTLRVSLSSR